MITTFFDFHVVNFLSNYTKTNFLSPERIHLKNKFSTTWAHTPIQIYLLSVYILKFHDVKLSTSCMRVCNTTSNLPPERIHDVKFTSWAYTRRQIYLLSLYPTSNFLPHERIHHVKSTYWAYTRRHIYLLSLYPTSNFLPPCCMHHVKFSTSWAHTPRQIFHLMSAYTTSNFLPPEHIHQDIFFPPERIHQVNFFPSQQILQVKIKKRRCGMIDNETTPHKRLKWHRN